MISLITVFWILIHRKQQNGAAIGLSLLPGFLQNLHFCHEIFRNAKARIMDGLRTNKQSTRVKMKSKKMSRCQVQTSKEGGSALRSRTLVSDCHIYSSTDVVNCNVFNHHERYQLCTRRTVLAKKLLNSRGHCSNTVQLHSHTWLRTGLEAGPDYPTTTFTSFDARSHSSPTPYRRSEKWG